MAWLPSQAVTTQMQGMLDPRASLNLYVQPGKHVLRLDYKCSRRVTSGCSLDLISFRTSALRHDPAPVRISGPTPRQLGLARLQELQTEGLNSRTVLLC